MAESPALRAALAAAGEDQIVFDIAGIENKYDSLIRALPGIAVRFAMKACPLDDVLGALAKRGAGFDAASPNEITQALATGVSVDRVHYGNTVKSDRNIETAYRAGVRDFVTDSVQDVAAIAAYAPGSRVFCRLASTGDGALWALNQKAGCSGADAVVVLERARSLGLVPAGLSVHVGSQQMQPAAWSRAADDLAAVVAELGRRGIHLEHINLGGGLPAAGYANRHGERLHPPLDEIFAAIRAGMRRLREVSASALEFILEPGRYLVAEHGAIRAHVARLSTREQLTGERENWLYLSCGKFNGLYEMDQVQYRLVFPAAGDGPRVPAVIAGPSCDSDDSFTHEHNLIEVPAATASGDPVWILSSGAYAMSYTTQGFNGFDPLPTTFVYAETTGPRPRPITEDDWDAVVALESTAYAGLGLSEDRAALRSRAAPGLSFVLDDGDRIAGYLLALPYPPLSHPDLTRAEHRVHASDNLHLHDVVVAAELRGGGLGRRLLAHLHETAAAKGFRQVSLVAVDGTASFWAANGYHPHHEAPSHSSYGPGAVHMSREI
jgi:diaminopimelate decarboxylase/GNAT superfamily N-acetyltransferase